MPGLEVVPVVVTMVTDLAQAFVVAVSRPWRYALSPTYRASVDADLASRGRLHRVWYLGWGALAIALTAVVGGAVIRVAVAAETSPTRQGLRRAAAAVVAHVERRADSGTTSSIDRR